MLSDFERAMTDFFADMLAKFHAKDAKHGDSSIVRQSEEKAASMEGLFDHFWDEVRELSEAPLDRTEMVDVANMCFAMWWQVRSTESQATKENG